jgi:hypothetical protein
MTEFFIHPRDNLTSPVTLRAFVCHRATNRCCSTYTELYKPRRNYWSLSTPPHICTRARRCSVFVIMGDIYLLSYTVIALCKQRRCMALASLRCHHHEPLRLLHRSYSVD